MGILLTWLINTVAILIVAYILPGITIAGFWTAVISALILGILNAILKPLLIILTLPINILTLGLFTFVINALIILLAAAMVPGFNVDGFWQALLFSLILSLLTWVLSKIVD